MHDIFGLQSELSAEESKSTKRRLLNDLLSSYADEADVFSEIIQNSFDAIVEAHSEGLYSSGLKPRMTLFIGRRDNSPHYFGVSDNGVGMSDNVARKFTAPGYSSLKKVGKSIGYKGVGASFFFAASNRITFSTKHFTGSETRATVHGSLNWLRDDSASEPIVTDDFNLPLSADNVPQHSHGTSLFYFFDPGWKPSSLTYIVKKDDDAKEIESWAFFLSSRTALGYSYDLPFELEIEIVLDRGDGNITRSVKKHGVWSPHDHTIGYPFPWRVLKVAHEIDVIDSTPPCQQNTHFRKYQAIRKRFSVDSVIGLQNPIEFTDDEREIVEGYLDFVDMFFAYSTDVFKIITERSGCRAAPVRYGVKLLVDGVPQGRPLDFDLTSLQGLGRQAHCVIAFKRLSLDVGRKIPANEAVAEVIRKIGVRMMTIVSDYRWTLRIKDRPDIATDLADWVSKINSRTSGSIVRHLFELSSKISPLDVDPDSENDVIYLFGALVSQGLLKGYVVRALSGSARYDGIVNISDEPETRDYSDPLSLRDESASVAGDDKVLEFKFSFESLLEDFDTKKKNPVEIDVVVVWNLPSLSITRGSISYCYDDKEDTRPIYGCTHIWRDENDTSSLPIISLQHVCAILSRNLEKKKGISDLGDAIYKKLIGDDRDKSI